ncbi:Antigen WC1.1, partial [Galemys pyrenaicus]
ALQSQRRALPAKQTRLVDGGHRCAGTVEVSYHGVRMTVCDYGWDLHDAHVVCRELGCFEALNATVSAHFGERTDSILNREFQCTGEESLLADCTSVFLEDNYCSLGKEAGVICSGTGSAHFPGAYRMESSKEAGLTVHLAGGAGPCSGRVEVGYRGDWTPVSDQNFTSPTAQVICAEL